MFHSWDHFLSITAIFLDKKPLMTLFYPWPCRIQPWDSHLCEAARGGFNKWREFYQGCARMAQRPAIFNGHSRNLKWRYLPYIRIYKAYIIKAYVSEYPHKIWPYMVQYLHFRILKFPLKFWKLGHEEWA